MYSRGANLKEPGIRPRKKDRGDMADKHFSLDMTIAQALDVHPNVAKAFAAFHLGGCAHCHIGQVETLAQLCAGYGIEPAQLLEALEGAVAPSEA